MCGRDMTELGVGWGVVGSGLSNVVVGLSGAGLTGSYIFSQTIFSMRAGIDSRIHGMIIARAFFFPPVSIAICVRLKYCSTLLEMPMGKSHLRPSPVHHEVLPSAKAHVTGDTSSLDLTHARM